MRQFLGFVCVFVSFVGSVHAENLFGTIEFRANNLKALPRWQDVLHRTQQERPQFKACDVQIMSCASPALQSWRTFVDEHKDKPLAKQLRLLNRFANRWPYITDQKLWGVSDYWATPLEFLDHSGDCEDYAILKYMTLREWGVSKENLRIVVVQDKVRNIAHAVLAVYEDGQPIRVMDSLFNAVLFDTQLMQYTPYYSINETTRWAHVKPLKSKPRF